MRDWRPPFLGGSSNALPVFAGLMVGPPVGGLMVGLLVGGLMVGLLVGRLTVGPLMGRLTVGPLVGRLTVGPLVGGLMVGPLVGGLMVGTLMRGLMVGPPVGGLNSDGRVDSRTSSRRIQRWNRRSEGELSLRTMSLLLAKFLIEKHIRFLRKCCIACGTNYLDFEQKPKFSFMVSHAALLHKYLDTFNWDT